MPGNASASSPTTWSRPSVSTWGSWKGRPRRSRRPPSPRPRPAGRQQEGPRIGRVLLLYVDDTVDDATPFGAVRHRAFTILPREAMLGAGQRLCEKPVSQLELRWQAVDRTAARCKKHLR